MRGLALLLAALAGAAMAEPPESSLRPVARPAPPAGAAQAEAPVRETIRPPARPAAFGAVALAAAPEMVLETPLAGGAPGRPRARAVAVVATRSDARPDALPGASSGALPPADEGSAFAVAVAFSPSARPAGVAERAEERRAEAARGSVCGDALIQGEAAGPVGGGGGCGIEDAVRVRSVDGVALSQASLMDCGTAEALLDWVQGGARPAVGGRGGGLAGLEVMGHYVCRTRNNQPGAPVSEHGRGRAVDIGAVLLADGSRISVARDWPDPALAAMREAACGPFSTVLGPGSDRFHDDHLHLDTARGRGAYCR